MWRRGVRGCGEGVLVRGVEKVCVRESVEMGCVRGCVH